MRDIIGLKNFLEEKVDKYNHRVFIESDPIFVPHQYHLKEDIEISGFFYSDYLMGYRRDDKKEFAAS